MSNAGCLVFALAALVALPTPVRAAEIDPAAVQLWDVVYTTEGSVVKGVIVEEVPGTSLRIVLVGGSSLVVQMTSVVKLGKELNPAFGTAFGTAFGSASGAAAPGVRGTAGEGPSGAPAHVATSGLRVAVLPGIAFHTEGESTFLLTARAGWEFALDRWGLTPGVVVDYAPRTGTYGEASASITGAVRASYRGSTVSPFVGFAIGPDIVAGDTSLATVLSLGIDLVVHRRVALTAEGKFHRGFGDTYTQTLEFFALGMGVELRL